MVILTVQRIQTECHMASLSMTIKPLGFKRFHQKTEIIKL